MDLIFQLQSYELFQMVTEEILRNLHKASQLLSADIDSSVVDAAKAHVKKYIIENDFNIDNVAKQLQASEWDKDRIKYFIFLLKEKKNDVFHSIITHHNRSYADTLTDFDWLLKLVLGSSESKSLKYPLLQVVLSSINTTGNQKQRLYEMNKESLKKLINILEDYHNNVKT